MQPCASVRECPPTGKHVEAPDGSTLHNLRSVTLPAPDLDVHLMRLDVDAQQVEQCAMLLSADERARAKRFHFARDRRRFTVARATLRTLLGEQTGQSPAAIVFAQTRHGKPYLKSPATTLHFNVSHSAECAIFALSKSCVVGVDIERLERNVDHAEIAQRFFAPREYADLQRLPAAGRKRAFLACWTCKEAIVKAIGEGLQLPLNKIEVTIATDAEPRILRVPSGQLADWSLYRVDAGRDYVATVAAYRGPRAAIIPAPERDAD